MDITYCAKGVKYSTLPGTQPNSPVPAHPERVEHLVVPVGIGSLHACFILNIHTGTVTYNTHYIVFFNQFLDTVLIFVNNSNRMFLTGQVF